jgi:hypothetical protein
MNFREFSMPFLTAIVLAVLASAVFGPPAPEHTWVVKRHFAGPP